MTFLREFWQPSASSDGLANESEIKGYWRAYGGARAIWLSPYLWIAVALTSALFGFWSSGDWVAIALSVLPNLLGFSVGALAIVLAFPGARLFQILSEDGASDSYYMDLTARLVHFVFAQVFAIFSAMTAKTYPGCGQNFFGCVAFFYALLVAVAAALSLFGIAKIANAAAQSEDGEDPN